MTQRLLSALTRLRRGPQTDRGRRNIKLLGAAIFIVLSVVAYRSLPERREPVDWAVLVAVVVIGGPAMLAVTTAEYRELGRLSGVDLSWSTAANVTVAATAANLLPVPGSVLVRSAHLKNSGASNKSIAAAVTVFGVSFLGCASIGASVALGSEGREWVAVGLAAAGLAALAAGALVVARMEASDRWRLMARLVCVEVAVLGVIVVRLWIVLDAIGADSSWAAGLMLGSASVLTTAIAIFPGGLGLREGLSGLLGTTVGVDAASGVLAAGVDRVTFLIALAVITLASGIVLRDASALSRPVGSDVAEPD